MRLQRSLALLVLAAATAAPAFGQHHQQNADAAAFKPIDGGRRLDAFDDRMDRYEAIGNFEAEYWKNRGEAWHQWAIQQGYAPSENSHRAHPERFNPDGTLKAEYASPSAPEQQQKQEAQGEAGTGASDGKFNFWDYLDTEFYAQQAAEWEQYAQERGFLPTLSSSSEDNGDVQKRRRQLDAFDDRLDRYDAVAEFEKNYWKAYADGWVHWAQDMGYMPSPESQRVAAAKAAREAKAASSRRLDAFDDRVNRYEAVGEFEQAYWKAYADGWVEWAQRMGYAPTADSERVKAAAMEGRKQQQQQQDAFDERMGRYQAVGDFEADYWKRYGDGWVQWAVRQGYMPAPQQPEQGQGQQARRLDAFDDRVGGYEALGQNQADYWNKYGDSWVQWAVRQGYMPAPQPAEGDQQQPQQQPQGRRLDAFDDRMDRYEAIGKFEAEYWKNRGEAWHQWAIQQGYAPSETSHRAHPERFNPDGTLKAEYASAAVDGGNKAEAIPGDFYKEDGRSWAQWMAEQAFPGGFQRFDQEEMAAQGEAYPPTVGFAGREGSIAEYIQEKLAAQRSKMQEQEQQAATIEGTGEIGAAADKAHVANPYQYSTFMGRSAARVANGLATAAEAVVPPLAGNPLADAADAYKVATTKDHRALPATPATPAVPGVGGPATPATPATPAAPAKKGGAGAAPEGPKHKNMRGGGKGK